MSQQKYTKYEILEFV